MPLDCSLGLGFLPVIWAALTLLAFAASYLIAVADGHVYPVLPSISDTGARIPESNSFSLLMNISIMFALANFFTRYFQGQHQARHCGEKREKIYRYNSISLMLALISMFGAMIVANVQSRKEHYLREIHDAGAIIFFFFTVSYFWVQSFVSYQVALYGLYSQWLCHMRLFISILISISSSVYLVTSVVSYEMFTAVENHSTSLWSPGDEAYTLHVVSNASEWFSVLLMLIFAVSYFDEFQQVILIIDCQEKSPTIISYDAIGDYGCGKMGSMDSIATENNN